MSEQQVPQITWKGCAPDNFRAGRSRLDQTFQPEAIVIHIMAGSEVGTDSWFKTDSAHVSAHYGVSKAGEIHQYVKDEDTAFHCGIVENPAWGGLKTGVNPNLYTIGIEHEGGPEDEWPPEQYASSAWLIAQLAQKWGIALDRSHIVPHFWIRASKSCPGKVVDLDKLIAVAVAMSTGGETPASQSNVS